MRTLWLQLGGSEDVRRGLNLPALNYPLSYAVPRSAWNMRKTTIKLFQHTRKVGIFIDLVAEINCDLKCVDENTVEEMIRGYRWCVGVSDEGLIDNVPFPSVRDKVTCAYYSRFADGYNLVSRIFAENVRKACEKGIFILNESSCDFEPRLTNSPQRTISFLSMFTTLNKGDIISLGSLILCRELDNMLLEMNIKNQEYSWGVRIYREKRQ